MERFFSIKIKNSPTHIFLCYSLQLINRKKCDYTVILQATIDHSIKLPLIKVT